MGMVEQLRLRLLRKLRGDLVALGVVLVYHSESLGNGKRQVLRHGLVSVSSGIEVVVSV